MRARLLLGVGVAAGFLIVAAVLFAQTWRSNGQPYPNFAKIQYNHLPASQKKTMLYQLQKPVVKSICVEKTDRGNALLRAICNSPISNNQSNRR